MTEPPPGPPPPWRCRLRAVAVPVLLGYRPAALVVIRYADTPVGPYGEAALVRPTGVRAVAVPWIVVDSSSSRLAGRAHWGLPKDGALIDRDDDLRRASVASGDAAFFLRVRRRAPALLPLAVTVRLEQPGRTPAPLVLRGRGAPAVADLEGRLPPGVRRLPHSPVLLVDGVLFIGSPRPGPS